MNERDQKLLTAIKNGDPMGSVQELYDSEYPKIKRYIQQNNGDENDARDIFQETLMTLFSHVKLGKFKDEFEIGGFMFVVAMNRWKRKKGKEKPQVALEHVAETSHAANETYDQLFSEEKKRFVNNLFDQIGENCKRLLVLTIFEKTTMKEVADKLGYSTIDAAKTRHYKCKQKLIKLVQNKPEIQKYLRTEFAS